MSVQNVAEYTIQLSVLRVEYQYINRISFNDDIGGILCCVVKAILTLLAFTSLQTPATVSGCEVYSSLAGFYRNIGPTCVPIESCVPA